MGSHPKNLNQLSKYLQYLLKDLKKNPDTWENISLEDYLEAITAWLNDGGAKDMGQDALSPYQVANLFYVGKVYE